MLFSISSIGILSSVVEISATSNRRPPRPRSAPPSPPLHLRTSKTTQLHARVGKHTVKTHSSRFERRAARLGGSQSSGAHRHGAGGGGGRESSGSGWAALKSTGSRRRVHRSALAARATFRPTTGRRLAPAVTAAAAVIARQHRHPQPFVSSVGLFHFSLPDLWWNIRIHSEFRE